MLFTKGRIPWNKGKKGVQKSRKGIKRGKPAWNKGIPSPFKGIKRSKEIGSKISLSKKQSCYRHSNETKLKISLKKRGRRMSIATEFKKGKRLNWGPEILKKIREKRSGKNNPNWKGDAATSKIRDRMWQTLEYKNWRKLVLKRDKFTCIICGAKNTKGLDVKLHVDHIKPFSLFPELRLNLENGRTLCVPCHRDTDTYGGKINNYKIYINE